MSVVSEVSLDGKKLTITVKGRFDFGSHQAFRDAYERFYKVPEVYVVDLKDTTYMDSSALDLLLLWRSTAKPVSTANDKEAVTCQSSQKYPWTGRS